MVALAVEVFLLVRENSDLKSAQSITQVGIGDILNLQGLEPLTPNLKFEQSGEMLLFVFTTSCGYCKDNLPQWELLSSLAKDSGVESIAISLDTQVATADYAVEHGLTYPVLIATDPNEFGKSNGIGRVPQTIIRTQSGAVQAVWIGKLEDERVAEILSLLTTN
ncbi:MAG: redoxin family protein [Ignavibacteria bacterium]|nr:redoxin family protein [Ignavibacteria bacterium]